jgi:hypothetical protein
MSNKPDSKKAVTLKPGQRKLRRRKGHDGKPSDWVAHNSSYALDPWGVAIRVLRERGIPVD